MTTALAVEEFFAKTVYANLDGGGRHMPDTFNVAADSTDFVDRPVTIEHVEALAATRSERCRTVVLAASKVDVARWQRASGERP